MIKKKAIAQEDYSRADELKGLIQQRKSILKSSVADAERQTIQAELDDLHRAKARAVAAEDFKQANDLKGQIDEKQKALERLQATPSPALIK